MRSFYDLMGVSPDGFDPEHHFVTSWILPSSLLASLRFIISLYCFATIFTIWGWEGAHGDEELIGREFSYFTDLTFWAIAFYMLVASVHGFVYLRHGQSWLDRWPKPLQLLHSLYYTTVVNLPFLVTIVYWLLLYQAQGFSTTLDAWTNISKHGLNSLFAFLEIVLPATHPPPILHLPFIWLIMLLYLALAYLTHYTQGWYPYSFLDPSDGHSGRVAAYAFGILAANIVVFLAVWCLVWGRRKLTGHGKRCKRDVGPADGYFNGRPLDIEMSMK